MPQHAVWSTGHQQRVDAMPDRLGAAYEYAVKSESHLWIATLVHRLGDQALDAMDTPDPEAGPMLLDAESLLTMPMVGCYVCEQVYERRLRDRKCPGEASPR